MPIRLYCRATKAAAAAILASGFPESRETRVWLSKELDAVVEAGQWVLVVLLDVAEEVLEAFARDIPTEDTWDDESWDEAAGHWVKRTDPGAEPVRWYAVPSSILSRGALARILSPGLHRFRTEGEELACQLVLELELDRDLDLEEDPPAGWEVLCGFQSHCRETGGSLPC